MVNPNKLAWSFSSILHQIFLILYMFLLNMFWMWLVTLCYLFIWTLTKTMSNTLLHWRTYLLTLLCSIPQASLPPVWHLHQHGIQCTTRVNARHQTLNPLLSCFFTIVMSSENPSHRHQRHPFMGRCSSLTSQRNRRYLSTHTDQLRHYINHWSLLQHQVRRCAEPVDITEVHILHDHRKSSMPFLIRLYFQPFMTLSHLICCHFSHFSHSIALCSFSTSQKIQ